MEKRKTDTGTRSEKKVASQLKTSCPSCCSVSFVVAFKQVKSARGGGGTIHKLGTGTCHREGYRFSRFWYKERYRFSQFLQLV